MSNLRSRSQIDKTFRPCMPSRVLTHTYVCMSVRIFIYTYTQVKQSKCVPTKLSIYILSSIAHGTLQQLLVTSIPCMMQESVSGMPAHKQGHVNTISAL